MTYFCYFRVKHAKTQILGVKITRTDVLSICPGYFMINLDYVSVFFVYVLSRRMQSNECHAMTVTGRSCQ